jgi:hypothetical protein
LEPDCAAQKYSDFDRKKALFRSPNGYAALR